MRSINIPNRPKHDQSTWRRRDFLSRNVWAPFDRSYIVLFMISHDGLSSRSSCCSCIRSRPRCFVVPFPLQHSRGVPRVISDEPTFSHGVNLQGEDVGEMRRKRASSPGSEPNSGQHRRPAAQRRGERVVIQDYAIVSCSRQRSANAARREEDDRMKLAVWEWACQRATEMQMPPIIPLPC
ncbi:hypothetical protein BDZ45DRAFT_413824 [Acephala macrosclerotiorum]|nr:hypothetical protein BDZ45DRAFT_413824 [Acephala macrosclerotiorum]